MIRKLPILFLCLFLLMPFLMVSQENPCKGTANRKARKHYEKAIKALREKRSVQAIDYLVEALENDDEYADALWRLGQTYYNRQRYREAENELKQLVAICPAYNAEAYYLLARIVYGREEYNKAVSYLEAFLKDPDRIRSDKDYENGIYMLDQARFLDRILSRKVPFEPYRVEGISTREDEYLVIISPDGDLAFFTRRIKAKPALGSIDWSEKYTEQFMTSEKSDGHFSQGEIMQSPFNMMGNEGGATVTARNDELFYTVCQTIQKDDVLYNNCDIFYARLILDQWTELERLDTSGISLDDAWDSQPSVSADGRTLYFASDRPGGYGGADIYAVYKDANNQWGKPLNLGPTINTPGNEKTPFIHTDSHTLYFSSSDRYENDSLFQGHRGLGGYDIFYSRNREGKWEKPMNIGYPINSEADDLGFFVSTDGTTGYFASNKIEGSGGYDLYAFELYPEARPLKVLFIKGEIRDEDDVPMADSKVELKNVVTEEVSNIEVDEYSGKYVATAVFNNDFVLTVKKPDHIYQSRFIDKDSAVFSTPVQMDFEVEKVQKDKSYKLHDIYYATNSAELSSKSLFILNEFVVFLEDNPTIRVDIHGHTDDVGDDAFNQELSVRRARSVYDYLIMKGISSFRLQYHGFGESKPVTDNRTEEGRARNRRTEFVISHL